MELFDNFEVSIYGELQPFPKNPLLSQARLRIFYRGLNRNRTYINDEFAEKLLATLPYTPISGIYKDGDFTDHGTSRSDGRIYGIVPEEPNHAQELHVDSDGVERLYDCCDVVLFTSRYEEAKQIPEKGQSMELYRPSIKGEWVYKNGVKCFEYSEACFIGLQVLGDAVEPCFEGSAFYSYRDSIKELIDLLNEYTKDEGGNKSMDFSNFKISDREKQCALWDAINTSFNEEGGWEQTYCIVDVYNAYAVVHKCAENKYYRVYYTVQEDDTVEVGDFVECKIVDVTLEEAAALEMLQGLNGGNFDSIGTKFQSLTDENTTLNQKVVELENNITTLNENHAPIVEGFNRATEVINELNTKITELNTQIETSATEFNKVNDELNTLREFKASIDRANKIAEINNYANLLDQEVIVEFTNNVDSYSLEELQNGLKIAYVNANANSIFSNNNNNQSPNHLIPNFEDRLDKLSGAAGLIEKHKQNGGNL